MSDRFEIIPGGDPALFYSDSPAEDLCIGHMRFDFGRGKEFWHTWWPHKMDTVGNTPEFKLELSKLVNELRNGILKNTETMRREIARLSIPVLSDSRHHYGFHIETARHSYYVRLFPHSGDYSYIYAYLREDVLPKQKWGVFFTRHGYAEVEADSKEEAMRIADEELKCDDISWDDDWPCTDATPVEEMGS